MTTASQAKSSRPLERFVQSVRRRAIAHDVPAARAKIYGAWAACYYRYCLLKDKSWKSPEHVPGFLDYLQAQQQVDTSPGSKAVRSVIFLFEEILDTPVADEPWAREDTAQAPAAAPTAADKAASEKEQSTLLTKVLFHTSLTIREALDLCAGDLDFDAGIIYVSDQFGTPKRLEEMPAVLKQPLQAQVAEIEEEHGLMSANIRLFQANALEGNVDEQPSWASDEEPVQEAAVEEETEEGRSLWQYAE
ncbi:hypothetical protein [Salisaeta longa]|uniref:hypothetical protein n=1 Tax=Salisaeta longa TaxID=503170 RepID=UPI0003B6CAAA|nr:hypothetical protein [Salisaeta longa]